MKRLSAVIAITFVIVAGVTVAVIENGSDEDDGPASGRTFRQELTPGDRATARRVVERDPELRQILRGRDYAIESIGGWDARFLSRAPKEARQELLRLLTAVVVSVEPPIRKLEAQWPFTAELSPCKRLWVPLTVYDLSSVAVYVDVRRRSVPFFVPSEARRLSNWNVPKRPDSACASSRPS